MPILDWLGKSAVINHHNQVPYRLVHCNGSLSSGDKDSGNLLVQGDNLVALKALLPHYAGQVKCIYIDPPYNTGNEGWVYNDNVNSDTIRKWLGKVVGKDAEDLSRHDKWLCMMYPRLSLLKEFLRDDGVIFVSIDDNEQANLKFLMDEVFGSLSFMGQFVWKSRVSEDTRALNGISNDHEYIFAYANKKIPRLKGMEKEIAKFSNPDNDTRGIWRSADLTGLADKNARPNLHYSLVNPETGMTYECPSKGWRFDRSTMQKKIEEKRILWPINKTGRPRQKVFFYEMESLYKNVSSVITFTSTSRGTREINEILGKNIFQFPKPSDLICFLISQATSKNDLILDSFAGSGTTGHAVLQANAEDGGNRRFILVEMDKTIAQEVTAQRLTKVIGGYFKNGDTDKPVAGLGGGFRFCRLGKPLFDEWGELIGEATFSDIAAHVFFIETGSPIPKRADGSTPFIGAFQNKAVCLLYSTENTGMPLEGSGNTLTPELLPQLALPQECAAGSERVVYAEHCTLNPQQLEQENISFRQIPYHLTKEGQ